MSAIDRFPEGWRCTPDMLDAYHLLEVQMRRVIRARARDVRMSEDDAAELEQEGRIVLLRVLSRYDWTKSRGRFVAFANTSLRRGMSDGRRRMFGARRRPHVPISSSTHGDEGSVEIADPGPTHAEALEAEQHEERVAPLVDQFCDALKASLSGLDYAVFCLRAWPPPALECAGDVPTSAEVARHLGMSVAEAKRCERRAAAVAGEMLAHTRWAELAGELGDRVPERWRPECRA